MNPEQLTLYGVSSSKQNTNINSKWVWILKEDGDDESLEERVKPGTGSKKFFNEIKTYLPENYEEDILIPNFHWILPTYKVRVEEMSEPEEVYSIIEKYFKF